MPSKPTGNKDNTNNTDLAEKKRNRLKLEAEARERALEYKRYLQEQRNARSRPSSTSATAPASSTSTSRTTAAARKPKATVRGGSRGTTATGTPSPAGNSSKPVTARANKAVTNASSKRSSTTAASTSTGTALASAGTGGTSTRTRPVGIRSSRATKKAPSAVADSSRLPQRKEEDAMEVEKSPVVEIQDDDDVDDGQDVMDTIAEEYDKPEEDFPDPRPSKKRRTAYSSASSASAPRTNATSSAPAPQPAQQPQSSVMASAHQTPSYSFGGVVPGQSQGSTPQAPRPGFTFGNDPTVAFQTAVDQQDAPLQATPGFSMGMTTTVHATQAKPQPQFSLGAASTQANTAPSQQPQPLFSIGAASTPPTTTQSLQAKPLVGSDRAAMHNQGNVAASFRSDLTKGLEFPRRHPFGLTQTSGATNALHGKDGATSTNTFSRENSETVARPSYVSRKQPTQQVKPRCQDQPSQKFVHNANDHHSSATLGRQENQRADGNGTFLQDTNKESKEKTLPSSKIVDDFNGRNNREAMLGHEENQHTSGNDTPNEHEDVLEEDPNAGPKCSSQRMRSFVRFLGRCSAWSALGIFFLLVAALLTGQHPAVDKGYSGTALALVSAVDNSPTPSSTWTWLILRVTPFLSASFTPSSDMTVKTSTDRVCYVDSFHDESADAWEVRVSENTDHNGCEAATKTIDCPQNAVCSGGIIVSCRSSYMEVVGSHCVLTKEANETVQAMEQLLDAWTSDDICRFWGGNPFVAQRGSKDKDGGSDRTGRALFLYSQLSGELELGYDLDLIHLVNNMRGAETPLFDLEISKNDQVLIGLHQSRPLRMVDRQCQFRLFGMAILSVLWVLLRSTVQVMLAFAFQSLKASPITTSVLLGSIYIFVSSSIMYRRRLLKRKLLEKDVLEMRQCVYEELSASPETSVAPSTLCSRIVWKRFPVGRESRARWQFVVWPHVVRDIMEDSRVARRSFGDGEVWSWVDPVRIHSPQRSTDRRR